MAAERKLMRVLRQHTLLTDDVLAGLAELPISVELAARRRLVRRGEVVRVKVYSGRMAWRAN